MNRISFLAFASLLSLSACALADPAGLPMPRMTFAEVQPLPINVRAVIVHPNEGAKPDDFIISPSRAMEEYLARRFRAGGMAGTLEATVENAGVTKTHAASGNVVAGYLGVGGTDNYDVTLTIRFQRLDEHGSMTYGKVLTARRSMHITEHASIAEREQHEMEGMESLFHDLDAQVRPLVLDEMGLRM